MNNETKIGSEFIDNFQKKELTIFGIKYRMIILMFSIISLVLLTLVIDYFSLPKMLVNIYTVIVVIPGVLIGIEADKLLKLKARIHFFFLIKRRVYKTSEEMKKEILRKESTKGKNDI